MEGDQRWWQCRLELADTSEGELKMKFGSMCLKSEAMARVTYAKLPTSFPARLSAIFSPFLTASAPGMQARESVSIRRVLPRKETCVKSMRSLGLSRSFAVPEDSMESAAARLRSRLDEADGRNEG
ncbi:unnamed protein product [Symbiodinium microadriaticum]|nr:unnamed protein product [Symbiodinium microadriaticum]